MTERTLIVSFESSCQCL